MWYMYLWYPGSFILYVAENNIGTQPHPFAFSSLHNVEKEIYLFYMVIILQHTMHSLPLQLKNKNKWCKSKNVFVKSILQPNGTYKKVIKMR